MQTWQITPFFFLYLGAAATCALMAWMALRTRRSRARNLFALFALSTTVWSLGYLLGFFNTGLAWKLALLRVEYLGVAGASVFWLLFVATYTQYDRWLNPLSLAAVGAIPTLTVLQVAFLESHDFYYRSYSLTVQNGLVVLEKVYGPGFVLWTAWSSLSFLAAALVLIQRTMRMPRHLRGTSALLALVVIMLSLTNVLQLSGQNPIAPYQPTPLAFSVAAVLFMLAMRLHRFVAVMPVAHDLVFATVDAGILITDARGRLVDANPPASDWLGHAEPDLIGTPIQDVLPLWQPTAVGEEERAGEIRIEAHTSPRILEMRTTPMRDSTGELRGHVTLLHDVSERRKLEAEQERLIDELQAALAEIKTLSGLLPICAGCKRIRDDGGSWTDVELFIRDRSEARFSHGICPDCSHTLYPEMRFGE